MNKRRLWVLYETYPFKVEIGRFKKRSVALKELEKVKKGLKIEKLEW